jgi:hypothetical protein
MPKRSSSKRSLRDKISIATLRQVLQQTEGEARRKKNPAAVALGRLGGLKGGRARAEALSAKRRREIAQKAARKRWHGKA